MFFCFLREHGLQGLDSLKVCTVGFFKLPLHARQLYLCYLQLDLLELLHPMTRKGKNLLSGLPADIPIVS